MDGLNPQQHGESFPSILHAAVCAIFAFVGAAFSALDPDQKMRHVAWHCCSAAFIGGSIVYGQIAIWPNVPWFVCIPVSGLLGLAITPVMIAIRRNSNRLKNVDVVTPYAPANDNKGSDGDDTT